MPEGLYMLSGPGMPQDSPGGARECCWGEVEMVEWMAGWMMSMPGLR